MMAENMAALLVFVWGALGFALGYALRPIYHGTFRAWADTFTYRQHQPRKRAAYRMLDDGS